MPGRTYSIAALLLALLILPVTCFALQKGDLFPELSGQTLDSQDFNFAQLKGRPFLLKIGTTWCPACNEQNTEITKIGSILDKNDIQYIEIFVQEAAATIAKHLERDNNRRPDIILRDQGDIARRLNVFVIPRLLLVDKDFRVFSDSNPVDSEALAAKINEMLTGK